MKLADLAFMSGTWECEAWGGTYQESWFAPTLDAMQGMSRLVIGDATKLMEYACVEAIENGLTYYVMLGKPSSGSKNPAAFACTHFEPGHVIFERDAKGFPQKIEYLTVDADHMTATISGKEGDEEQIPVVFKFKRLKR